MVAAFCSIEGGYKMWYYEIDKSGFVSHQNTNGMESIGNENRGFEWQPSQGR